MLETHAYLCHWAADCWSREEAEIKIGCLVQQREQGREACVRPEANDKPADEIDES